MASLRPVRKAVLAAVVLLALAGLAAATLTQTVKVSDVVAGGKSISLPAFAAEIFQDAKKPATALSVPAAGFSKLFIFVTVRPVSDQQKQLTINGDPKEPSFRVDGSDGPRPHRPLSGMFIVTNPAGATDVAFPSTDNKDTYIEKRSIVVLGV